MAAAAEEVVAEGSSSKFKAPSSPLELELEGVEAEEMGGSRGWVLERERRWEGARVADEDMAFSEVEVGREVGRESGVLGPGVSGGERGDPPAPAAAAAASFEEREDFRGGRSIFACCRSSR